MLLALMLQAAVPAIAVEPIDASHYRLSLADAGDLSIRDAQQRMIATARMVCREKPPIFGAYRYSPAEEGGARLRLEQELVCVSLDLPPPADGALDPLREQAAIATSYAYLAAKDSGRYDEAYAVLSDRMKARTPEAEWRTQAEAFAAASGPSRGRRVVEVTWYDNPSDAPEPGRYVAADFSADFAKLEFACGYLMWKVQPDGSFRLVREEQNFIDRKKRGIASLDRAPLRAQMGCKD